MPSVQNKVWFIDANILAHWVLGKGDVLSFLIENFHLTSEFFDVYSKRYEDSIGFIEELIKSGSQQKNDDIVLLSSIAIISPKGSLYPDYCACVLKSPFVFKQIEGSKRGTGLRRIILHDLKRFQIPLPPLLEQRRIAEVLGTVDSAIQKVGGANFKNKIWIRSTSSN